jgi:hypothetical protein
VKTNARSVPDKRIVGEASAKRERLGIKSGIQPGLTDAAMNTSELRALRRKEAWGGEERYLSKFAVQCTAAWKPEDIKQQGEQDMQPHQPELKSDKLAGDLGGQDMTYFIARPRTQIHESIRGDDD